MNTKNTGFQYDKDITTGQSVIYAFQNLIIFMASAVVMPIVVGYAVGLSQAEVAQMLQRTFFLCGIMTLLQVKWGHGFPIQEGPAGLWSGIFLSLAGITSASGGELTVLRRNLECALLICGIYVMLLVCTGLIDKIGRYFTHTINGIVIILMSLQISASIMKGFTGSASEDPAFKTKSVLIGIFTLLTILLVLKYAHGFLQSIAAFIGVAAGWILAIILGIENETLLTAERVMELPAIFAWGKPSFDLGITITCVIGATVLLSMCFASIDGMAKTLGEEATRQKMQRGIFFHGLAECLTGIYATIAFMPYVSSIGVLEMTKVAAKKPFYLVSGCMLLMGIFPVIGIFFSGLPSCVGNGALLSIFAMCLTQGWREIMMGGFGKKEEYVTGISMMIGVGIMFLPSDTFDYLPTAVSCILSNGMITGVLAAFLLERLLKDFE